MLPGKISSRGVTETDGSVPDMRRAVPAVPRVYVVSDVRLYRDGLVASLARQGELNVLGAGCSGESLDQIVPLRPEVLLLDLAAHDSLAIPRQAQQVLPGLLVVAFAVAEREQNILACAEAGISGYVAEDASVEDLVAAVLCALRGEMMCSPRVAALLFSRVATLSGRCPATPADASLTPREREIAALVACNLPNKEIARRLCLGPATIKNHVHNILQKLNVHRRGDIASLHPERNLWRLR
jgi:two-component system, NarL family, nitrate/nitrite response regulator NarL